MADSTEKDHGNVLLRALPVVETKEDALRRLFAQPDARPANFDSLPLFTQLEELEKLQELFIPCDHHAYALLRLLRVIRWSYSHRDPRRPEVMTFIHELCATGQVPSGGLKRLSMGGGGAIGMANIGVTGAGKTSWGDRVEATLPRKTIVHEELNGLPCRWPQIVLLRVQCPNKASLAGFALEVLRAVDVAVGTRHFQSCRRMRQPDLLVQMAAVCSAYFLGALIVDDVQKLRSWTKEAPALLDEFCSFMERTGIPVVICGTYALERLLADDIKIGSKLTAKGLIEFPRLSKSSDDWARLCEGYWELGVTPSMGPMPKDLPDLLYFHNQGVPRVLRETMFCLFERLAMNPNASVSEAMLDEIAQTDLAKYQEAMAVLRRANLGRQTTEDFLHYEDLLPAPRDTVRKAISERATSEPAPAVTPKKETAPKSTAKGAASRAGRREGKPKDAARVLAESIAASAQPHKTCKELGLIGEPLLALQ